MFVTRRILLYLLNHKTKFMTYILSHLIETRHQEYFLLL